MRCPSASDCNIEHIDSDSLEHCTVPGQARSYGGDHDRQRAGAVCDGDSAAEPNMMKRPVQPTGHRT